MSRSKYSNVPAGDSVFACCLFYSPDLDEPFTGQHSDEVCKCLPEMHELAFGHKVFSLL